MKKCFLFQCCGCAPPPRGEVAVSFAARIDREAFREAVLDREKANQESATEECDQRIEVLEKDLTRLTLAVEKVVEAQQQQQQDLTKATLVLEQVANDVKK